MKRTVLLFAALALFAGCSKSSGNNSPVYATNCATSLAGVYSGNDFCSGASPSAYPSTITTTSPTTITISDLYGIPVTATVNCSNNSINIPNQNSTNFSISGSGTYTASRITINWTVITTGQAISCSTNYTR